MAGVCVFNLRIASLLLLFAAISTAEVCPFPCVCYPNLDEDRSTLTVDCRGQELVEVPYLIPNSTSHLDLSGNEIEFIRMGDLPVLPRLTYLQLQNNAITRILPGALQGLTNLQRLTLYNNRIMELERGVFQGLSRLQHLDAYNIQLQNYDIDVFNSLENIVEIDLSFNNLQNIAQGSFSGLRRLQRLTLSYNFITNIEAMAITNLSSLIHLAIDNNQLTSITPRAFTRLPSIRTVALQGNPLECGCDALWLYNWLNRKRLTGPTCAQPENLAGRGLLSLQLMEFCALPVANIPGPDDIITTAGMTLQLQCLATGAPPPEVTWSREGMTFDIDDERVEMMGGSLVITGVNESDSGTYYCTAISTAGRVAVSTRVTVLNETAENFTSILARLRQNMELECSDSLPPGIPVTWEFNSTRLLSSDKYVVTVNGSLLVRNVQLEDMGEYQCVVNGVRLTRELVIEASPEIAVFPEGPCENPSELTVNSNEVTPLTCAVFGIPPPTVRWFYNGNLQVTQLPAPGVEGGTTTAVLELFRPAPEQGGMYTCVADNELGNTTRTVVITVRLILQPGVAPIIELDRVVGDTVVMECDTVGIMGQIIMVQWERMDGLPLPFSRINFTSSNTTLVLKDVRSPDDIAIYTCRVQSEGGVVQILNYALALVDPPSIERQCDIPVVVRLVGDDIILNCSATGNPPVDITWTKDGQDIFQALPGRVQLMNNGMRLLILSAEDEDSGNYTCLAVNRINNDTYTIALDVQRRPYFLHRPMDRQVSEREIAQLRCEGAGNPQPTVTWWRLFNRSMGVQQVRPSSWVIISDQYLVFLEAQASDEGEYYCNISSPIQTRTTADDPTFLRVYIPPSLPPLQVEYRVLEGEDNVTLECRGTGDPVPNVHWLRNSDILPRAGQFQLPDGSLVIEGVEAEDAGEYTCRVANVAGMVYHTVNLIVRTLPDTRVEPRSLRANVGCQATLFCSDGGETPIEEVTWTFNGRDLVSGGRVVIRRSGELVISDLQVADTGNYTCAIWGLAGAGESTALLIVEDPLFGSGVDTSPPSISSPTPSSQEIPNGQTAQFLCVATGFPQPTIRWLRNGQPQPNFRRVTIDGGSLTIEQLRITDTATYECVATSILGEDRMAFTLTVTQLPSLLTLPVPLTLTEVQTLRLSCTAEGDPEPEVMWLINNTEVTSDRVVIGNGSLVIYNTSVSDSGAYSCVARNSAGVVQYTVPVVVRPQQVAPNITVPPRSITTTAGNSIALDCIAGGIPDPQITWLKDGELLVTTCSSVDEVECVRVDGPSVFIQSAEERDTGRYTCVAENTAGRAVYEVFITVETARILPFFTVYPMPVWVTNGTTISVDCQAGGSPPPNVTWLIGFEPVNETEGVMVLDNGTLVIEDAGFEDSGLYTCRASNSAGVNQIVITIDVVREEDVITLPPVVGISLAPIDLAPGETITLDCVANGNPTPNVVWLREGEELNYTEYNNIYLADNGSLVLANVTELDEGNYTCQALNNGGTAEVHIRIEVLEGLASGQGAPRFTVMPHDQQVLSGSPVQVDCQARGSPTPYIMWTHSDRPVYESDLVSVAANGSLMIISAKMAHTGRYKCRATNNKGVAEMGIELKIMPREEPPYFVTQPADTRVVVGNHFILRCEAASHEGHTHTRWLVDGQEVGGARREVLGDGSLLVVKTKLSDSGDYTCSASNQHGQMNATAHVRILRLPLNITRSIPTGSSTQLECGLGGRQVWTKDGHSLSVSSRLLVYGTSLWVFRVQEGDEGEYTCTGGSYVTNYYLEVLVSPKIVDSSTLVVVHKGRTAAMHCIAEGTPHPRLSWLRGGQELEQHNHYSSLHNGTLLVYSTDPGRDSGEYVCQAVNKAGTAQSTVLVIVTA